MSNFRLRGLLAPFAVLAYLCSFMLMPVANAGVIGTQTALDQQARTAQVAQVQALLAQDAVQEQMIALGVDPAAAQARVASLTDAELAQMQGQLEELPAGGGVLAVLGIVFVVLLVLELLGVTNVFTGA